jgi:tetratricopeptide (TPR) repeat protein
MQLAQAYEGAGEYALALEAIADADRLGSGNSKISSMRGYVLAMIGRTDAARKELRAIEAAGRERYMPPYAMALVYAGLGERDQLFSALEQAYAVRDIHLMSHNPEVRIDQDRQPSMVTRRDDIAVLKGDLS